MTTDFVAKLRELDVKNSQHELSIEKLLVKNEVFFDKLKDDKRENAASLRSQSDSFYHLSVSPRSSFYSTQLDCKCHHLLLHHLLSPIFSF